MYELKNVQGYLLINLYKHIIQLFCSQLLKTFENYFNQVKRRCLYLIKH
jgi:hypothetical protein